MTAPPPGTYCHAALGHEFHGPYHDLEYGFPLRDDDRLFERLILEINQAGLSWVTILKVDAAIENAKRIPGAHHPACPVFARVQAADPPWIR